MTAVLVVVGWFVLALGLAMLLGHLARFSDLPSTTLPARLDPRAEQYAVEIKQRATEVAPAVFTTLLAALVLLGVGAAQDEFGGPRVMRPGQLLTAVTYAGWGLCFGGLIVGRWPDAQIRGAVSPALNPTTATPVSAEPPSCSTTPTPSQNWSSTAMDIPTYPSGSRPTVAGLIVSGRLKPLPEPRIGRHSDERRDLPRAVSVADLAERVADTHVVRWFTAQQASDTRRIERVALPTLGGAA